MNYDKILLRMGKKKLEYPRWLTVIGPYRKRWWMKPICWLFKHQYKRVTEYGIFYKQCKRCGKPIYNKMSKKLDKAFYKGEIGTLYGIRFVTSRKVKKPLTNKE